MINESTFLVLASSNSSLETNLRLAIPWKPTLRDVRKKRDEKRVEVGRLNYWKNN